MGAAQSNNGLQTFFPNYPKMGLIEVFGCAVLFFAFFIYFMESRSPPPEVRPVLFRGFLLHLAQTELSLLVLLAAGTWFGRVRVSAAGVQSSDVWGIPIFFTWDEMTRVHFHSVLGIETLRVYSLMGPRFLSLPLCVFRRRHLIAAIEANAPPGNALREYLDG